MAALRRLPNLAALRAFEAAARHQNFSRAAAEIHLTHGAISHQVRALEEELGVLLFTRNGKRLTVTPEGAQFAQVLRKSLDEIANAAEAMRSASQHQRLTVSSIPSFAARWLAPRLGKFIDLHPEIELMLQSSSYLQDLALDAIDVGLRFGMGRYPGLEVEELMGDYFYPAVSPHYNGGQLPATPAALAHATLLRSDEIWSPWFAAAGVDLPEPTGGLLFHDSSMLVRSAVNGDGVGLVRHVVAAQEIASGELVRLFDVSVKSDRAYYFACTASAARKPQVIAFHTWLLREIAAFKAQERSFAL
jgi:LysR family glycine cleavage system transcriptional activator